MDHGRYGRQQGLDNDSAFDRYRASISQTFGGVGGEYNDRRFADNIHPRNSFHRNMLERENFHSNWPQGPQARRRSHGNEIDRFHDYDKFRGCRGEGDFQDYGHDGDYYDYKSCIRERENDYDRHNSDTVYERGSKRECVWRNRDSRDLEKRSPSRGIDRSHPRILDHSRSRGRDDKYMSRSLRKRSHGRDNREDSYERSERCDRRRDRSRSPRKLDRSRSRGHDDKYMSKSLRERSHGRGNREDNFERYERSDRRRDHEYSHEHYLGAPSATVVVKGLTKETNEEDLHRILAEWGPLHVRVIREYGSGISRRYAFVDFTSVGAARALMDKVGVDGLVVDGKKLLFEYKYSGKPTGGIAFQSDQSSHSDQMFPSDWICSICGYDNFARQKSCFQCKKAEMRLSHSSWMGKKEDTGPTHVLIVRGLDENANEEMLRNEFSKHAPLKVIHLVRDKYTNVSRGFAFVFFHTVDDANKAMEATNGTTLEKNGQMLKVAFAQNIMGTGGSGYGPSGSSHSSSLAAANIEAVAFSQLHDAAGWAPKEYNPYEKQSTGVQEPSGGAVDGPNNASGPPTRFIWDEASGKYYDTVSGYYYDADSGLYYDGNTGSYYDHKIGKWQTSYQQTQQYPPCT